MNKKLLTKIKIIAKTDLNPIDLASHAALKCYQAETPKIGKRIQVKDRLYDVGHHTTLQHYFFTFDIENISIGDITLGFHLVNPFYNSDQRSGRYCARMFLEPNYKNIKEYITTYWPEINNLWKKKIIKYIQEGVFIFHNNIDKVNLITKKILQNERPFVNNKYLEINAKKIAQEQLRVFIPVIFPTGLDFTINLTALSALYFSAWTPAMKKITKQMVKEVIDILPELKFMFNPQFRRKREWAPKIKNSNKILSKPKLDLLSIDENFIYPNEYDMHPVDLLHFMPEYMNNSVYDIKTKVELSLATMAQDQRHRTIRRGLPCFTGNFYLPNAIKKANLLPEAEKYLKLWKSFKNNIPNTLFSIIAPYGAMISYVKKGSLNAIAHEQAKRLCFCAQEEIYNLGILLRKAIKEKTKNKKILKMFEPPCAKSGKCAEGLRYCGRDINLRNKNYYPKRKV